MKDVILVTDGACIGNPGPGGWAFIIRYKKQYKEVSGHSPATTNNKMELTAAIEGLKMLKEPCRVTIISDSQYLLRGLFEWMPKWKKFKFQKQVKFEGHTWMAPMPNADLWIELNRLSGIHELSGQWVRGHSGHPDNERCDKLSTKAARLVCY